MALQEHCSLRETLSQQHPLLDSALAPLWTVSRLPSPHYLLPPLGLQAQEAWRKDMRLMGKEVEILCNTLVCITKLVLSASPRDLLELA